MRNGAPQERGSWKKSGPLLVALAALFWSTNGVGIKFVDSDPMTIAVMRTLFAGLAMVPLARRREIRFSWDLVGLALSYALMNGSFVAATKWTAAGNAIALQYTAPLWIFLALAAARLVKPTFSRIAPMAMVLAGITAFMLEPADGDRMAGNLLGILSGVGFALVTVFLGRLGGAHVFTVLCLNNLAAALMLAPLAGGLSRLSELDASSWVCLAWLGIFQMGAGYVFYHAGLKRVTALKASTIALLEPVLNPVWVFLLIGEAPTSMGIAGALIILSGVALDLKLNAS